MSNPFLKWAGGKRWLISSEQLPIIPTYNRYIEPFLGGGAMFFHLQPKSAILSDLNSDLIELYTVMRDQPEELGLAMSSHQAMHDKSYYYEVRSGVPTKPLDRASRILYLNRTCWNGLYRVNLKGEFNVPIGTKNAGVAEDNDFGLFAKALKSADLTCCDFEITVGRAEKGDLLFVDPPYTVQHNMNGFVKYNEKIFLWSDQVRLKNAIEKAIARGASVIVTNADHSSIHSLYREISTYTKLRRSTVLAGSGGRRGTTSEALFVANL